MGPFLSKGKGGVIGVGWACRAVGGIAIRVNDPCSPLGELQESGPRDSCCVVLRMPTDWDLRSFPSALVVSCIGSACTCSLAEMPFDPWQSLREDLNMGPFLPKVKGSTKGVGWVCKGLGGMVINDPWSLVTSGFAVPETRASAFSWRNSLSLALWSAACCCIWLQSSTLACVSWFLPRRDCTASCWDKVASNELSILSPCRTPSIASDSDSEWWRMEDLLLVFCEVWLRRGESLPFKFIAFDSAGTASSSGRWRGLVLRFCIASCSSLSSSATWDKQGI